jgi:hypothetical protein
MAKSSILKQLLSDARGMRWEKLTHFMQHPVLEFTTNWAENLISFHTF